MALVIGSFFLLIVALDITQTLAGTWTRRCRRCGRVYTRACPLSCLGELTADEVLELFAGHEDQVNATWQRLAEIHPDATLRDAVLAWLQQDFAGC